MGIWDEIRGKFASSDTQQIQSAEQQPAEEKKLAEYVKKKVEDVRSQANRVAHEGIWMTNIAYLLGFDSVYYDPYLRQFRPQGRGTRFLKRNRVHSNLILPACQNRLARLCKSPPKYDVRPDSMEQEDRDAARLAVEAINMIWDKQHINKKRQVLMMWVQECGHAYVKTTWDDTLGNPLPDGQGFEGDIRIDVCSAFELFVDPLAKELEEAAWLVHAKVRPLEYFRVHYPDRGGLVKEEGAWLLSSQYEMRINTLSTSGPNSSGTQEQMKNAAIEMCYYEKPSSKHPQGRTVVTANGVLLKNDELAIGEIPFAKFDDVLIGGKFYSESLITHARPLQDQFNQILTKRSAWVNKCLTGKYIAARGHGLIQEAINDQSGEVVEYDPVPGAPEPKAMIIPVLPQYAYAETEDIQRQINELFGLSEVSRGNMPSASTPAVGMQLLLEQDETRIGAEVEQNEHAWARIGGQILKYMDKCYVTSRKLKTKGKGMSTHVKNFTGEDLKGNLDVTVIRGSTVPNSKTMKRQDIMNLYQTGLLGDPQDPTVRENVLGWLEFGDVGEAWQRYAVDKEQIDRTIKEIEQEIEPDVNKLDNHPMHINMKNDYRKSDKYLALSDTSKALLEADIQEHVSLGAALANPQLQNQPDQGPNPEMMMQQMQQQAAELGIDPNEPMPQNGMGEPNGPATEPGNAPSAPGPQGQGS